MSWLPKLTGLYLTPQAWGAGHGSAELNIRDSDFPTSFGLVFFYILTPFQNVNAYPVPLYNSSALAFIFHCSQLRACLESRRRIYTWTFEQFWNC